MGIQHCKVQSSEALEGEEERRGEGKEREEEEEEGSPRGRLWKVRGV